MIFLGDAFDKNKDDYQTYLFLKNNIKNNKLIWVLGNHDLYLLNVLKNVKKHIAIEILLNMILGKSSKLYKELYEEGILFVTPSLDYEFARGYAHESTR